MPIPFPPDGPQVQAAMSKMPGGVLQNYAAGTPVQPTGQVTPGPLGAAAGALNARGAMGAANQRQQAMNNKVSNSTVFQQKDMELAQKAQQLQQKEQQLGVINALMAKKAQDLQARESMGVANLPIRPDMFTAMDGGIVFAGGGGVEGYASKGMVGEYSPVPKRAGILEAAGLSVDEEEEKNPLDVTIGRMRKGVVDLEDAERAARLSPEEKKRRLEESTAEDKALYEKYKKGIAGLDEQMVKAMLGKEPDMLSGIVSGIPTDRGRRVSDVILGMAKGVSAQQAAYGDRASKAAMYMAEAKRKQALADLEEERGRPERAKKLVADAESDLAKAYEIRSGVIKTGIKTETDIAGLQNKEELARERLRARERETALNRELGYAKIDAIVAKATANAAAGGKTDLQVLARTYAAALEEENNKLPPSQRKSKAMIDQEAFKLATSTMYRAREMSARASEMRASTANAKNITEALSKLRYDPEYIEATPERKRQMEDEERARFPSSGATPPGAIPYPQSPQRNAPPPPPGFVPNSR
jgi:hypothetical protein